MKSRGVIDFTTLPVDVGRVGEWECLMFAHDDDLSGLLELLQGYTKRGLWLTRVNQENPQNIEMLEKIGAQFVSAKVSAVSPSDLYGIWYVGKRQVKSVNPDQRLCFGKIDQDKRLGSLAPLFSDGKLEFSVTDRGKEYGGPDKTWSRVVIRNARDSRLHVKKELQRHRVFQIAPTLLDVLEKVCPLEFLDCMMLTKVEPKKGVITRHTDIALDKKKVVKGVTSGMTRRVHIVIQSNPECVFHIWDLLGNRHSVCMKTGDIWYTDVRKPHAVGNTGGRTRIHLVADFFSEGRKWNFTEIIGV